MDSRSSQEPFDRRRRQRATRDADSNIHPASDNLEALAPANRDGTDNAEHQSPRQFSLRGTMRRITGSMFGRVEDSIMRRVQREAGSMGLARSRDSSRPPTRGRRYHTDASTQTAINDSLEHGSDDSDSILRMPAPERFRGRATYINGGPILRSQAQEASAQRIPGGRNSVDSSRSRRSRNSVPSLNMDWEYPPPAVPDFATQPPATPLRSGILAAPNSTTTGLGQRAPPTQGNGLGAGNARRRSQSLLAPIREEGRSQLRPQGSTAENRDVIDLDQALIPQETRTTNQASTRGAFNQSTESLARSVATQGSRGSTYSGRKALLSDVPPLSNAEPVVDPETRTLHRRSDLGNHWRFYALPSHRYLEGFDQDSVADARAMGMDIADVDVLDPVPTYVEANEHPGVAALRLQAPQNPDLTFAWEHARFAPADLGHLVFDQEHPEHRLPGEEITLLNQEMPSSPPDYEHAIPEHERPRRASTLYPTPNQPLRSQVSRLSLEYDQMMLDNVLTGSELRSSRPTTPARSPYLDELSSLTRVESASTTTSSLRQQPVIPPRGSSLASELRRSPGPARTLRHQPPQLLTEGNLRELARGEEVPTGQGQLRTAASIVSMRAQTGNAEDGSSKDDTDSLCSINTAGRRRRRSSAANNGSGYGRA